MKLEIFAASFVAAVSIAGVASAATVTCATSGKPGESIFTVDDATAAMCTNLPGTGDSLSGVNGLNAFGYSDWHLAEKNDGPDGDGYISFGTQPINDVAFGFLEIFGPLPLDVSDIMVSLKTGGNAALFLMDLDDLASNWSIFEKDLSHASLFYRDSGPAQVPLPASGLLLLAAVGGLAMRRRKG
jgi:hypothetical protein